VKCVGSLALELLGLAQTERATMVTASNSEREMDTLRAILDWIVKQKYWSLLIAFVLIGGIVATRAYLRSSAGKLSDPVKRGDIIEAVYGIGTVTATNRISFNTMVGATFSQIYVREGDRVTKGMPMIRTDNGNILRAPFNGVANYFPYHLGENALVSSPMLIITDMSDRYVVVTMEQQGALQVKVGQVAKLSFDSLRKATFDGKVAAVYSYANNFLARIDAVALPIAVLPDMTCDVAIVIDVHKHVLVVPITAFESGGVWVKRGNALARKVSVEVGINDGVFIEIMKGDVQEGDRVMIRPQVGV
jgi:multidrug efflux pump subunit AcrA (membrane-fusion protein)